jgi:hypothetical protein
MTADEMVATVHRELRKAGLPEWSRSDGEIRAKMLELLTRREGVVTLDRDQQRMLVAITVRDIVDASAPRIP